jgi:hypothetical protein
MKTGIGLQWLNWKDYETSQLIEIINRLGYNQVLRFPPGEGSEDFDYVNSVKDKYEFDRFLELAKAMNVEVVIPLNSYHELMSQKYSGYTDKALIARRSNLAMVEAVVRAGVSVAAFAICNELYAKNELIGWSVNPLTKKPEWSRNLASNITAMNTAADNYLALVVEYKWLIGIHETYALCMGTDLNLGRKTWDSRLYSHIGNTKYILDAHLYPSRNVTGQALKDLIEKRLGRGFRTGAQIIIGETNTDFNMYGNEKIDPYSGSIAHENHRKQIIEYSTPYASHLIFHRLSSKEYNAYNLYKAA